MKKQQVKKTYLKVDSKIHRALKHASAAAGRKLEAVTDEVIRAGMEVKNITQAEKPAI